MISLSKLFSNFSAFDKKKCLLAFSGGPDSVYLLIMLHLFYNEDLNRYIEIAYVNYHDSDEVDKEEKIVKYYTNIYNLKLNKIDTIVPNSENFEDWARKFRYNYFKEIIAKKNLDGLLVAHQQNDLIETYIIQKNRHSFPLNYGLKFHNNFNGIDIYRPLLDVTKEEIYSYLYDMKYPFYEDKTNKNLKHERNRLRTLSLSKKEIKRILNEINDKNLHLNVLYSSFNNLNKTISFNYYDSLNIEEKKRLIFYILNRDLSFLNINKKEHLLNTIYDFLNKKENNLLLLTDDYHLLKTKDIFFISSIINKTYSIKVESPTIIKNDFFEVDLTKININLIKGYPIVIRNHFKEDEFITDIKEKNVDVFLKKHQVPFYLKNIFPTITYQNKVVYVPFYDDILKGLSPFKLPYLK